MSGESTTTGNMIDGLFRRVTQLEQRLDAIIADDTGQSIAVDFSAGWNAGFSAARQTYCDEPSEQELYDCLFAARDIITDRGGEAVWEGDFHAILDRQEEAVEAPRPEPNRVTKAALREAVDGSTRAFDSADELMEHLDKPEAPPPDEVVAALREEGMPIVKSYATLVAAVRELSWAFHDGYVNSSATHERMDNINAIAYAVQEMNG